LRGDVTERVTVDTERKRKRKRADGRINIVTKPGDKIYSVFFLKSRRLCENTSISFGYVLKGCWIDREVRHK
jgi:hypothetical protein